MERRQQTYSKAQLHAISKWLTALGLLVLTFGPTAQAAQPVLQRGYDAGVSGANLTETTLNTSNVAPSTFGLVFKLPLDDSVLAQPLYVPNVAIPSQGTHNVVYVATMSDTLYAFDADTGAQLWSVNFATSVGATPVPYAKFAFSGNRNIVGNLGILSTPVIDPSTNILYLVACTLEDGGTTMAYRLHAVNITNGTEPYTNVQISNNFGGPTFDAPHQTQRLSLVLSGNQVVFGFGAMEEEGSDIGGYVGWVMAYDKTTLAQSGAFATVKTGTMGGGVWQSGRPPVVDSSGYVYVFVGNGYTRGYDGVNNFSESALKLDPATGLNLLDWFTPDDWAYLDESDLDLSASGPLLIPDTSPSLLAGGGKAGVLYVLKTANLGKESATDSGVAQEETITNEFRGGPVYWQRSSANGGPLLYNWGARDSVKAYAFNGATFATTPSFQGSGTQIWPGGILALSADSDTPGSGVLWATVATSGDAENNPPVPGELHAFDAGNVSQELWNSTMNASRDGFGNFAKFVPPLVANGKVYVATWSNQLAVYALLFDLHGVADLFGVWQRDDECRECGAVSGGDEHRHGVAAHHEHHPLGPEPQPVLPDQYLRDVGRGRSDLHDQRGVQADLDRTEDGDAERQRRRRCRDADRGAQRNRCRTDLHGVADLFGVWQRDDECRECGAVSGGDEHRHGVAAHHEHHALGPEPQSVLPDQYLRDVGRGRSKLYGQCGVQSSLGGLGKRDAERQRRRRCRDADRGAQRNRCRTDLHGVADLFGVWQPDDQRRECGAVSGGDEHRHGVAAHHEHHALGPEPQPVLPDQYLRDVGRGRSKLYGQCGVQSSLGGLGKRDAERQRRRRCRDADRGAQRNRCRTDLHGVADLFGVWQPDDQRCECGAVGDGDEHRHGVAAHHEHHALGPEPQPVLPDQYLRDVGRGRSKLYGQCGVQSSLGGLGKHDAERQRRRKNVNGQLIG